MRRYPQRAVFDDANLVRHIIHLMTPDRSEHASQTAAQTHPHAARQAALRLIGECGAARHRFDSVVAAGKKTRTLAQSRHLTPCRDGRPPSPLALGRWILGILPRADRQSVRDERDALTLAAFQRPGWQLPKWTVHLAGNNVPRYIFHQAQPFNWLRTLIALSETNVAGYRAARPFMLPDVEHRKHYLRLACTISECLNTFCAEEMSLENTPPPLKLGEWTRAWQSDEFHGYTFGRAELIAKSAGKLAKQPWLTKRERERQGKLCKKLERLLAHRPSCANELGTPALTKLFLQNYISVPALCGGQSRCANFVLGKGAEVGDAFPLLKSVINTPYLMRLDLSRSRLGDVLTANLIRAIPNQLVALNVSDTSSGDGALAAFGEQLPRLQALTFFDCRLNQKQSSIGWRSLAEKVDVPAIADTQTRWLLQTDDRAAVHTLIRTLEQSIPPTGPTDNMWLTVQIDDNLFVNGAQLLIWSDRQWRNRADSLARRGIELWPAPHPGSNTMAGHLPGHLS